METNAELTNNFINQSINNRIVNWTGEDKCTAEATSTLVDTWHRTGSFVVANAGGYDSMGLNHLRGLMQARIIGAIHLLGGEGSVNDIYELASSEDIRLLISLDTNDALEENKSYKANGAYSVRPLLDWDTRARTLALQGFGGGRELVDFITKHGPLACSVCVAESCNHSSKTFNIADSGADLIVLKDINTDQLANYPNTSFHVIEETEGAFHDKLLGGQISTSALVRRIIQKDKKI